MAFSQVGITFGSQVRPFNYRANSSDGVTLRQIFVDRHYDLSELRRYGELRALLDAKRRQGLRPLIVDAGANIGASAVFFAANVPGAVVAAIEPSPENFAVLSSNVEGLDIRPFHAGVSSQPGRLRVVDPGASYDSLRTERLTADEPAAAEVPAITIPQVLAAMDDGRSFPFMVKIDIEGSEKDLFSANTDWVAAIPVIAVELHDWMMPASGASLPFLRCIAQYERDFLIQGENILSIAHRLA